jgi:hypothetical protein
MIMQFCTRHEYERFLAMPFSEVLERGTCCELLNCQKFV